MKRYPPFLHSAALAALITSAHAAPVFIPNGNFDDGQGSWGELGDDGGSVVHSYPDSGGNPGDHGVMDNTGGGGWGIWVSNSNSPTPLADLGLSAENTYTFSQDMKILSGSTLGGFKVDFFNGTIANGTTNDIFPAVIGDGSTWETYTFTVPIPSGTDGIIVVPLWGADSSVAYDNIQVEDVALAAITEIPDFDFEAADGEAWEKTSEDGAFVFEFPAIGGNPGGYGLIDNSGGGGWAVMVANAGGTNVGASIPLSVLGLTAGKTYLFTQDMKIFSGSNIGAFKVDYFNGAAPDGSTDNLFPELIGDGSMWETYEFQVSIPATTTAIKIVPVWGENSAVGYDNITFSTVPLDVPVPVVPPIANADFEEGATGWLSFFYEGGVTEFSYPATGGNPGGYGQMKNVGGDWAVLVPNGGAVTPLGRFGITEEGTYQFKMDMKIFEGSSIGGLKIDYYLNGGDHGNSGDIFPVLIGDGTTWETYTFEMFIPGDATGIKVVPLRGADSTVGYDNIVAPSPAGFANWMAGFPNVGSQTGFDDDPDGDGQPNGVENFFGTDPSVSSQGLVVGSYNVVNQAFIFSHPQNADPVPEAAHPIYTWSTDLVTYYPNDDSNPAGTTVTFETSVDTPTQGVTTVEALIFGPIPAKVFVRVSASATAE